MLLQTTRFGELTVEDSKIVTFPQGIYGFEQYSKYVTLQTEEDSPFCYLQSAEDGDLAFIMTNPFFFFNDYEFQLHPSVQKELDIKEEKEVQVWSIVSVRDKLENATCNLLAPLVFNLNKNVAKQVILHGTAYKTRHLLFAAPAGGTNDKGSDKDAGAVPQEG